ncbi:hypothetical protein J6590_034340 [Homalodisca vitripennis]|nr:hypothetical protein J6590_034340 [Homalodisca vitripennis]
MERRKTDLLTKSKNLLQSLQGYKKTSEEEQSTKIGPNVDWSNGELPKKIVSENPYTFCEADVVSSKPCISVAQMPTTASVSAGHTQNVESSLVNRRYFGTKAIPVYKWGLKFDIESGQSVGAFDLYDVEGELILINGSGWSAGIIPPHLMLVSNPTPQPLLPLYRPSPPQTMKRCGRFGQCVNFQTCV